MILIALGSNIGGRWGPPRTTMRAALRRLDRDGVRVARLSALYRTAPLGRPDQPAFLNAVCAVVTGLAPEKLLAKLQAIEVDAGRYRGPRWAARTLDLDILDYHGMRCATGRLVLPHREMARRPFVLVPLAEIAPRWRHPVSGETARQLLDKLANREQGRILARVPW